MQNLRQLILLRRGRWKSVNAAATSANNVTWTALTDDQATLSIGAVAIQPGNSDPTRSVVLVGTGDSSTSHFTFDCLRIISPTIFIDVSRLERYTIP
jgi:hypothetical protein